MDKARGDRDGPGTPGRNKGNVQRGHGKWRDIKERYFDFNPKIQRLCSFISVPVTVTPQSGVDICSDCAICATDSVSPIRWPGWARRVAAKAWVT